MSLNAHTHTSDRRVADPFCSVLDSAWILNAYIRVWALWSRLTSRFPTWVLLIGSGLLTQTIMQYLHAKKPEEVARLAQLALDKQEKEKRTLEEAEASSSTTGKTTATEPKTSATMASKRGKGKSAAAVNDEDVKVTVKTKKV